MPMTMAMSGFKMVRATPAIVWAALNDVDCLKLCIPGCRSLRRDSETRFHLVVAVALGPVQVEFRGRVEIAHADPPHEFRLTARGEGGLAGLASGFAHIRLTDVPGGCRLTYNVASEEHGPLAGLGSFFVSGVARTMTDRFVATFADTVGMPAVGPILAVTAKDTV